MRILFVFVLLLGLFSCGEDTSSSSDTISLNSNDSPLKKDDAGLAEINTVPILGPDKLSICEVALKVSIENIKSMEIILFIIVFFLQI